MFPSIQTKQPRQARRPDLQFFTTSGLWAKPPGARLVRVITIGGGTSGQGGDWETGSNANGGNGGQQGMVTDVFFDAGQLLDYEIITIGSGGAQVAGQNVAAGLATASNAGGDTMFGGATIGTSKVYAGGGKQSGANVTAGTIGSGVNTEGYAYLPMSAPGNGGSGGSGGSTVESICGTPQAGTGGGGATSTTAFAGAASFGVPPFGAARANVNIVTGAAGGTAGNPGGAGLNGSLSSYTLMGGGGAGGGAGLNVVGAAGGAGGTPGGGGGGGGGCFKATGGVGGAGGAGGSGGIYVFTYF